MNKRTRDSVRTGPQRAALVALPLLLALSLVAALLLSPHSSRAQSPTYLGLDLASDDNSGAFLGSVQDCLEVQVGQIFPLDIYVNDVSELRAFELRFAFDHEILRMVGHDFEQFLITTAPRGSVFPTLFEMETPDRYFLAAAEFGGTPDSGSGVLARLTLEALAPGRSPVTIVTDPSYFSPRLTDADGDALFQGTVSDGEVSVGQPCSPPSSRPNPPTQPGSTPTAGGEGGSPPSQSDGGTPLNTPPPLVALSDAPPQAPAGEGTEQGAPDASEPSATAGADEAAAQPSGTDATVEPADGPSADAAGSDTMGSLQPPETSGEDGAAPDQGAAAPAADSGSSGFDWPWRTVLVVTVFALVGGSALIVVSLRSRP